jgi:hypothetical protein
MDAVTRKWLWRLNDAMEAEDEKLVMELAGVDRITARFMIGVGKGRINGCYGDAAAPADPQPDEQAITPAAHRA